MIEIFKILWYGLKEWYVIMLKFYVWNCLHTVVMGHVNVMDYDQSVSKLDYV